MVQRTRGEAGMARRRTGRAGGRAEFDEAVESIVAEAEGLDGASPSRNGSHARPRVSLRLDCPAWLRDALKVAARAEDVSASHLGAFLVAWGLGLLGPPSDSPLSPNSTGDLRGGEARALRAAMEENRHVYRSLNAGHGLSLEGLEGGVTDSAVGESGGSGAS